LAQYKITTKNFGGDVKPEDLIKGTPPKRLHLNVRLTGIEAGIWEEYVRRTPELTDSQRVRDAIRLAVHALLTKNPAVKELGLLQPGDDGGSGRRGYKRRARGDE
jgi:hypothetical protein